MSRIGKRPVTVPAGVTATVDGQTVKMKGPKGQLQFVVHDDVEVKLDNGAIKVDPRFETKRAQALYGTARAQVANLVEGVAKLRGATHPPIINKARYKFLGLNLDYSIDKARRMLGYVPLFTFDQAIERAMAEHRPSSAREQSAAATAS